MISAEPTQEGRYRPDIDGLRAVAVFFVVAFHTFTDLMPGGFVGVDVFFVISGYLITGLILREIDNAEFSFRKFYERRARRLFPALSTVLAVVLFVGALVLFPADYKRLSIHTFGSVFFVPNLIYWSESSYFDTTSAGKPLLHLWSLGVEEQFYLIWPFVLLLFCKRRRFLPLSLACLVAMSFAYSVYATAQTPVAAFYSPLSRLWELGVGGILAALGVNQTRQEWLSIAGVLIIATTAIALSSNADFPGFWALSPVLGSAMIIVGGSRFLAFKPFVAVGKISYPIYLWHWPVLSFGTFLKLQGYQTRLALVLACCVLAWLTHRFVEIPIQKGRWRHISIPAAGTSMAIVGCASFVIYGADGLPSRFSKDIRPVLALMDYDYAIGTRLSKCWLINEPFSSFDRECRNGKVLIWGDSHAAMLYPGLRALFHDVSQFTRSSCLPVMKNVKALCLDSNTKILETIGVLRPTMVVIFAAWFGYDTTQWGENWAYRQGLKQSLEILHSVGVENIIVLGPAPKAPPVGSGDATG